MVLTLTVATVHADEDDYTRNFQATEAEMRNWAVPIDRASNLFRITPHLYRSEQPSGYDLERLKALGIKTVISFRAFHDDNRITFAHTGIQLLRVPMHTWDIDDRHIVAALSAIRKSEKQGAVLIHCQHGADRTGLVAAMYRIVYQSWTREQALKELVLGRYGYHALWRNIPRYLMRADIDAIRQKVAQASLTT